MISYKNTTTCVLKYDGTREDLATISRKLKNIFNETGRGNVVQRQDGTIHFYYQYINISNQALDDPFVYEYTVAPGKIIVQCERCRPLVFNNSDEVEDFLGSREER